MARIYSSARSVLVMVGRVVAAQRMDKTSIWISLAWTFQEATLSVESWVLIEWNLPGSFHTIRNLSVEKLKGNLAVVRLSELLELPPGGDFEYGEMQVKGRHIQCEPGYAFNCLGMDRTAKIALRPGLLTPINLKEQSIESSCSTNYGESIGSNEEY